jgi:hypothetical protein
MAAYLSRLTFPLKHDEPKISPVGKLKVIEII